MTMYAAANECVGKLAAPLAAGAVKMAKPTMLLGALPTAYPYPLSLLDGPRVTIFTAPEPSVSEVVVVTGEAGGELTIERGQEGTAASSHVAGVVVANLVNDSYITQLQAIPAQVESGAVPSGLYHPNAWQESVGGTPTSPRLVTPATAAGVINFHQETEANVGYVGGFPTPGTVLADGTKMPNQFLTAVYGLGSIVFMNQAESVANTEERLACSGSENIVVLGGHSETWYWNPGKKQWTDVGAGGLVGKGSIVATPFTRTRGVGHGPIPEATEPASITTAAKAVYLGDQGTLARIIAIVGGSAFKTFILEHGRNVWLPASVTVAQSQLLGGWEESEEAEPKGSVFDYGVDYTWVPTSANAISLTLTNVIPETRVVFVAVGG